MSRKASKRGRKPGDKSASDAPQATIVPPPLPPPVPKAANTKAPRADADSFASLPPELVIEERPSLASGIEELRARPSQPLPRASPPAAPPEDAALVDALVGMRPFYREREQTSERAQAFDFADLSLLPGNPYQGSSLRPPTDAPRAASERRWPARVALTAAFVGVAVLSFFAGALSERAAPRETVRVTAPAEEKLIAAATSAAPAAAPAAASAAIAPSDEPVVREAEPVTGAAEAAPSLPEPEAVESAASATHVEPVAPPLPTLTLARGWRANEPAATERSEPTLTAAAAPQPQAPSIATAVPAVVAPAAPPPARAVTASLSRPPRAVAPAPTAAATASTSPATSVVAPAEPASPAPAPAPVSAPAAPASPRAAAFFAAASSAEAEARAAAEAAAAKPPPPLPKLPPPRAVKAAFERIHAQLAACAEGKHGLVTIRATITGEGRVTSASASGVVTGAEEHTCLARTIQAAQFPPFAQTTFNVSYALAL